MKWDFYFSQTAEIKLKRNYAMQGKEYKETWFAGQLYNEAIEHDKTPLLPDDDLKLVGTGSMNDTR